MKDIWYLEGDDRDGHSSLFSSGSLPSELFNPSGTSFGSSSCSSLEGSYPPNHMNMQFDLSSDDMAITRAIAAVISSSSSSSSLSPSSSMLYRPQPHQTAFRPYNPSLAPKKNSLINQKMLKISLSVSQRVDSTRKEEGRIRSLEPPSSGIQMLHIMSERKRREKLNGSFHALRSLLPPGTKKDKASVLKNTTNYLSMLKAQISKLEEENTMLEMVEAVEDYDRPTIERVNVRRVGGLKSKSGGHQMVEIKISTRVGCDIIELVLHLLECLKGMRLGSVMSFDVNTHSFVQATLRLQIKDSDWDEEWFKEAMSRAVDGVATVAT